MKCFSSFLFRNQNLCLQKKRDGPSPLSIIVNWCPNIRLSIRPLSVGKIVPLFIIVTSCPRPSIRVRLYQRTGSDQVGPVHAFWSANSKTYFTYICTKLKCWSLTTRSISYSLVHFVTFDQDMYDLSCNHCLASINHWVNTQYMLNRLLPSRRPKYPPTSGMKSDMSYK